MNLSVSQTKTFCTKSIKNMKCCLSEWEDAASASLRLEECSFLSCHIAAAVAPCTLACSTVSLSHMSEVALCSAMLFYKVPILAVMVSTANIGLLCDYDQKIFKYSSTSKADREEMHWKLMLLWGLGSPQGALTPLWVLLNYFYGIEDKLHWIPNVWMLQYVSWRWVIWWWFNLIFLKKTHISTAALKESTDLPHNMVLFHLSIKQRLICCKKQTDQTHDQPTLTLGVFVFYSHKMFKWYSIYSERVNNKTLLVLNNLPLTKVRRSPCVQTELISCSTTEERLRLFFVAPQGVCFSKIWCFVFFSVRLSFNFVTLQTRSTRSLSIMYFCVLDTGFG